MTDGSQFFWLWYVNCFTISYGACDSYTDKLRQQQTRTLIEFV